MHERVLDAPNECDPPTARQEHDAITYAEVLHGVRCEHDCRRRIGQPAQPCDHTRARRWTETGGRFAQEEPGRVRHPPPGDPPPLALTATQRANTRVRARAEAYRGERTFDGAVNCRRAC